MAICSQGCRVSGKSLVRWFTGLAAATPLGVVTSWGVVEGYPLPCLMSFSRWAMAAFLDVVTTVVASFLEPLLCGVAVGLAASGHA
uniref:Uncharacterized protein n=1 Tax=Oryza rufipogon TaxID=4529 RepID=A0A0E0QP99_ORYRU